MVPPWDGPFFGFPMKFVSFLFSGTCPGEGITQEKAEGFFLAGPQDTLPRPPFFPISTAGPRKNLFPHGRQHVFFGAVLRFVREYKRLTPDQFSLLFPFI